jgi:hypothetical protein
MKYTNKTFTLPTNNNRKLTDDEYNVCVGVITPEFFCNQHCPAQHNRRGKLYVKHVKGCPVAPSK